MALHYDGEVKITKVAGMSPMMNNGYLITCPETNECILIDTPGEPEKLLGAITDENIKAILITHNHGDHLAGFGEITGKVDAPVGISPADAHALPRPPEIDLTDGKVIKFGNQELTVLTPPAIPMARPVSWLESTCSPATRCSPAAPASPAARRRSSNC